MALRPLICGPNSCLLVKRICFVTFWYIYSNLFYHVPWHFILFLSRHCILWLIWFCSFKISVWTDLSFSVLKEKCLLKEYLEPQTGHVRLQGEVLLRAQGVKTLHSRMKASPTDQQNNYFTHNNHSVLHRKWNTTNTYTRKISLNRFITKPHPLV